jgi:gliding motility-associated-like protein
VILSVDSVGYRDVDIVLDPSLGTAPFLFAVDVMEPDNDARKTNLAYAPHVAKVIDAAGCEAVMDFVVVPPAINPPVMFSPNGDGENDAWSIPGFEETYPDAVIVIFDRFGKKLLEMKGSDGGWDGVYNGVEMPSTDYWYEINVDEVDKVYVGHFTLVRD